VVPEVYRSTATSSGAAGAGAGTGFTARASRKEPDPRTAGTFLYGDLFEPLGSRDDDRSGRIRQNVGDLGGGKPVVHRHRDAPRGDGAEIGDDELRNVLQEDGDTFPRRNRAGPQEGGEPAATVVERRV
jgi:hypothetical protein